MENSEITNKQTKENIKNNENIRENKAGSESNNTTIRKSKFEEQGLNEVGEYSGDRKMKKDPEEFKHLQEVCAAFFNYKVKNFLKV